MKRVLALALFLGVILLLTGCGASKPKSAAQVAGRARFAVTWPLRSKLIPVASNSIKVTIFFKDTLLATRILARPLDGGMTTATFDNLPATTLTVTMAAYPETDATGVAQAQASAIVAILPGQVTATTLTMESAIDRFAFSPANVYLVKGNMPSAEMSVSALDAKGNIVLTPAANWEWSSSDPAVASLSASGATATITAMTPGVTTLVIREKESGKSFSTTVPVLPRYKIVDLGNPGREGRVFSNGLNNLGDAIGYVYGFFWFGNYIWRDAGVVEVDITPVAINDLVQVLGNGALWQEGKVTQLPLLPGYTKVEGKGLNNRSQIAGTASANFDKSRAVLIQNGIAYDLDPSATYPYTTAVGINDMGQIAVNELAAAGYPVRALLWTPSTPNGTVGSMVELSASSEGQTIAKAINGSGVVAVDGRTPFLWKEGKRTDIGVSPISINKLDHVVGFHDSQPCLWRDGKTIALTDLFPPNTSWKLVHITGINNRGQISGDGTIYPDSAGSADRAFVMTPEE